MIDFILTTTHFGLKFRNFYFRFTKKWSMSKTPTYLSLILWSGDNHLTSLNWITEPYFFAELVNIFATKKISSQFCSSSPGITVYFLIIVIRKRKLVRAAIRDLRYAYPYVRVQVKITKWRRQTGATFIFLNEEKLIFMFWIPHHLINILKCKNIIIAIVLCLMVCI